MMDQSLVPNISMTPFCSPGNRKWKIEQTAANNGAYLDELYGYNALNELTSTARGQLNTAHNAITAHAGLAEGWSLDGMGNWSNYTQSGGASTIDQDRNTNALNEITSIGSSWETPLYDAAGNMTTMPRPGNETTGLTCKYDAWNRLVKVQSGETTLATYSYDGLNRRVTETAGGNIRIYFFSAADQVLEERVSSSPLPLGEGQGEGEFFAALPADRQYVWGLHYVDDLVLRDRDNGTGGSLGKSGSGLGERLYALQDANWNVVAIVNSSGIVQERFSYTAYGTATALNANFTSYSGSTNFHWTTLFAGRDVDAATRLYYNNARWYNPSLGEFTTTDPLAADRNTYRYAGNNPVVLTDPSGLYISPELYPTWDPGLNMNQFQFQTYSFTRNRTTGLLDPDASNPGSLSDEQLHDGHVIIFVDGQPGNIEEIKWSQMTGQSLARQFPLSALPRTVRFSSTGSFFGVLWGTFLRMGRLASSPGRMIPDTEDFWKRRDDYLQDLWDACNIGGTVWQKQAEIEGDVTGMYGVACMFSSPAATLEQKTAQLSARLASLEGRYAVVQNALQDAVMEREAINLFAEGLALEEEMQLLEGQILINNLGLGR